MMTLKNFRPHGPLAGLGLSLLLAATAAMAQVPITASGSTGIDNSGDARKERAACLAGRSQEDQATCLREVNNAAAAKRAGKLDNSGSQFEVNARQRCEVLSGDDRTACEARVMGYGNSSGSVAGGGVIREVETVVVPPGATSVRIEPQTSAPVLILPVPDK